MSPEKKRKRKIRILLADDHPVVREGIRSCLKGDKHLEIVGEAANGEEAVAKARELDPDVVLMDINMPGMSGLDATRIIRRDLPEIRVLVLTVHKKKEYFVQMIRSGAHGYVLKDASPAELIKSIETVERGEPCYNDSLAQSLLKDYVAIDAGREVPKPAHLTNREVEVLCLIAKGRTSKSIASDLGLSVRTIESHRDHIMRKLNIHNAAGLTRYAIAEGLVKLED